MAIADQSILDHLEPIAKLSAGRKKELAALCFTEKVNKDIDPTRMNVAKAAQALYLLKGDLSLRYYDDKNVTIRGGTEAAQHPVNADQKVAQTVALTEIEILRIDMDLLDIMMTWDQLSSAGKPPKAIQQAQDVQPAVAEAPPSSADEWLNDTKVFSAFNLQSGVFSRLPAANIEAMFKRMVTVNVTAGQVVIQQGGQGDYYYLIQRGIALVSRVVDANQPAQLLAELHAGSAFGEEALVSNDKRNATVTMKTDGELLRLSKQDFIALLKEPLISQVSMALATEKVAAGAVWVDVRFPSEYMHEHIPHAINLPLSEIRKLAPTLDKSKEYILYCQTGRRSSAAAFVLVQSGLDAKVLKGGTRNGQA